MVDAAFDTSMPSVTTSSSEDSSVKSDNELSDRLSSSSSMAWQGGRFQTGRVSDIFTERRYDVTHLYFDPVSKIDPLAYN
jgi:hypothetical protein